MKPVAFELERPDSVAEALSLLGQAGDEGKVLAGGQSLIPLLNFRLARPRVLVDLNRVGELDYVRVDDGHLQVGAMVRQRTLERSPLVGEGFELLREALPLVAHAPIRNRGTVGGSLAHADSSAELCAVSMAMDALFVARGEQGERVIPAGDFFEGFFTTALAPEEILAEVRFPGQPAGTGWAFEEVARRRGDFALVAAAALLRLHPSGEVADARLAFASMGPTPMRAPRAEAQLRGQPATEDTFREAAEAAVEELEPGSDLHASRDYRRHLAAVLCRRALVAARGRATNGHRPPAV